jgi:hypothetical protein
MEKLVNRQLILILSTLSLCGTTQADTQIKVMDKDGESTTITSNGNFARLDDSSESGYVLIDTRQQQLKMVDPQRRQVMVVDLKNAKKTTQPTTQVKVSLNKIGKGPKIAGYSTDKYTLTADGKLCNTIYSSRTAINIKGIAELFDAMDTMEQQSINMMGGFRSMMDECDEANMQSTKLFKTAGAPLRTIDADGQLESEVQSINNNAKIDKTYYQIPTAYQQVSMQQHMEQARQQMQQNMPDMNQIMQQMQQNGGSMSPEVMEQMKKMQQMINQQ